MKNLKELIANSPFKKQGHTTNVNLVNALKEIKFYNEIIINDEITAVADEINSNTFKLFVASFQRESNNWSIAMQQKFIENIIMGCKTEITLYTTINKNTNEGCLILDGQHRVLSILNFINGDIKPFGYSYKTLLENDVIHPRRLGTITLNILKFDNHNDAIKFYISINENITHNAEDIDKAKKYII